MKISTWSFHRNNRLAVKLLFEILNCRFRSSVYLAHFNSFHRSSSKALSSFPLCHQGEATHASTARKNCAPLIGTTMEEVCKFQYSFNVAKILSNRVPNQSIASLLSMCANTKPEPCKVIHLERPTGLDIIPDEVKFHTEKHAQKWKASNTGHSKAYSKNM